MLTLGIDDSGRGPVIGPMVLAGCLIDKTIEKEFKEMGVKDSKKLSPARREFLAKEIKKRAISFHVSITSPKEVDNRFSSGINLNHLEAIKSAEIISEINSKNQFIKVIIDCPSPNIPRWKDYLMEHIEKRDNLQVSCEHKADANHIAVAAASIIAKTTRDAEIEAIKKKIGQDFGSGYTSDPVTIKFLEDYFHKHRKDGIFRETWGTVKDHKAKKSQKKLDEF